MDIKEYAKKILEDAGCDEYTYGGEWSKNVLSDLKEAFPNGMEFPYIDVANAILEMSKTKPFYKAPFQVVWDTEDCTDGFDADSFEEAKAAALELLATWKAEEYMHLNCPEDLGKWSEEQIEDWDYMIYNCAVSVYKYNPDTDEYEEHWEPSYEDEREIGWLTYEDLMKVEGQR